MNLERKKNDTKLDLKKRAYLFGLEMLKLVDKLPNTRSARIIGDQLFRAATSIGANVVEAQGSSSRKDFTNYYHIAYKSANETRYWLCFVRDGHLLAEKELQEHLAEIEILIKILARSILTLKKNKE